MTVAVKARSVTMELSAAESKLILRLRMLAKAAYSAPVVMLVTTPPLTLSVMGKVENLEGQMVVLSSGSGLDGAMVRM